MNNILKSKLAKVSAAGVAAAALAVGVSAPASAQGIGSGVVNCDAPGNKQVAGALLGALAGGALGSNVAKNDRGTGTAIGAVVGAASGSYIGCKMQRTDAAQQGHYGYQPQVMSHQGFRLAPGLARASLAHDGDVYRANTAVNVRSAPTTNSGRVGQLRPGQTFQALARVHNSPWILVGENGVGVGYVHQSYVFPVSAGPQYASYRY